MAEVEAQPAPKPDAGVSDKAALLVRLDELLEHYLNSLDQYQRAQQQLTTHLTSGFLSLAKANFNNQSRTRYGQDYYDERMHATRKINVSVDGDDSSIAFAVAAAEAAPSPKEPTGAASSKAAAPSTKTASDAMPADSAPLSETEDEEIASTLIDYSDPLRWFGILVPPALRSAQASFVSAVEGPVPQLATLVRDMRRQEVDIARLRKQIRKL